MKTILFLNDKTGSPKLRLQNVAGDKVTVRTSEGTPGYNCDRWGHPCPDGVEHNVQVQAAFPISVPARQTRLSQRPVRSVSAVLGQARASLADVGSQPVHPTTERPTRVVEKPER
jgi:hypothetical protein